MGSRAIFIGVAIVLIAGTSTTHGQYFGEQVLEKSFERADFFFTPSYLLPFGIGNFRSVAVGVFDELLTNLAVNTARLSLDTTRRHYAYIDFRSLSEIRSSPGYYAPIFLRTVYDYGLILPYPRYYYTTRKELQPVFSAAYFARPSASGLPSLIVGGTYEIIFQDDRYHPIPQDIYRSVIGYDYLGVRTTAEDLPIVDRYKGSDNIHQQGHFLSVFGAYEVTSRLQLGARVSRVTFGRDGSFGSQNLWDSYYNPNAKSFWSNWESRDQQYRHWDISGSARYQVSDRSVLGFTLGRLGGTVSQFLNRSDSSLYAQGQVNVGTNWSYYMRSGFTDQHWDRRGRALYGGADFKTRASPLVDFNLYYFFSRQSVDINLRSTIIDTSYSSYRWTYRDTLVSRSVSDYALSDLRSGMGEETGNSHRIIGVMQWHPKEDTKVSIGLQLEFRNSETKTQEAVLARRRSESSWSYPSSQYYRYDQVKEDKNLLWTFQTSVTTVHVPLFFEWSLSNKVNLLLGINRTMSSWEIDDMTLAIFKLRERKWNSGSKKEENFGERYTMPKERVSEVRTSALAAITVTPAKFFSIRLLASPNVVHDYEGAHIQDLRWWIAFNLMP